MKIVLDLDGTVCRTNTFRQWTLRTFLRPNALNQSLYLRSVAVFVWFYLLRMLGLLSHRQMKGRFVARFAAMVGRASPLTTERYLREFAASMTGEYLNRQVIQEVCRLQNDPTTMSLRRDVALATAAPSFYAEYIAESLGWDCFSSEIDLDRISAKSADCWQENLGDMKLRSIRDWLEGDEFVLFTDHQDDWPLIELSALVYLVNPAAELVGRMVSAHKPFRMLGNEGLEPDKPSRFRPVFDTGPIDQLETTP